MCVLLYFVSLFTSSYGKPRVLVQTLVLHCPGTAELNTLRDYLQWYTQTSLFSVFAISFRTTAEGARTLASETTTEEKSHVGFWQCNKIQE